MEELKLVVENKSPTLAPAYGAKVLRAEYAYLLHDV